MGKGGQCGEGGGGGGEGRGKRGGGKEGEIAKKGGKGMKSKGVNGKRGEQGYGKMTGALGVVMPNSWCQTLGAKLKKWCHVSKREFSTKNAMAPEFSGIGLAPEF
ncbi:hypothetical protein Tco_0939348 [Tanacetum coccineum]|uniref:Uncharacterized protein n=1 Tax=Tanacetum coccineum TaxID=301880 RepID=A0ABQ5DLJ8_9ASTR